MSRRFTDKCYQLCVCVKETDPRPSGEVWLGAGQSENQSFDLWFQNTGRKHTVQPILELYHSSGPPPLRWSGWSCELEPSPVEQALVSRSLSSCMSPGLVLSAPLPPFLALAGDVCTPAESPALFLSQAPGSLVWALSCSREKGTAPPRLRHWQLQLATLRPFTDVSLIFGV